MHERPSRANLAAVLRRDSDAVQVFAVSPVSDPSEAERRQDGSRILPAGKSTHASEIVEVDLIP